METKTIAIFGASGRTGRPLLKKALEQHKVKALVRNPEKMEQHPNLELVKGNLLNAGDVEKTIAGTDAVINVAGHVKGSPENLQQISIQYILDSMKKNGVQRLISLTGGGVRDHQHDTPKFMDKMVAFIMKNVAGKGTRNALLDGRAHVETIKKSNTQWTVVRAPMLTEDPAKNHIEVGYVGQVPGFKLTREDLAEFILNELKQDQYIHQLPFLTNGK